MIRIRHQSASAFTLTELMISIALAIIIIIGVNAVFKTTSETLSAGQKIAEANRNEQSVATVLAEDMRNLVLPEEAPFLLIRSRREPGFVDQQDLAADLDYSPSDTDADDVDEAIRTFDPDGDGTEGETPQAVYNRRNHRIDTLRFFARGSFARQTGTNTLVDNMTAREAFITYGHMLQPDPGTSSPMLYRGVGTDYEGVKRGLSTGVYVDPTTPRTRSNNPLNFFAERWTLGRSVMLLARGEDTNNDGQDDVVYDTASGTAQRFIKRKALATDFTRLSPLSINSEVADAGNPYIQWSRSDLASMTMDTFRWILAHANANGEAWITGPHFEYRFEFNPIVNRPLGVGAVAQSSSALLSGCSHFIVEFAGDFMTQNADGSIVRFPDNYSRPDGVTDFIQLSATERRTRWYGMPRDVDGLDANGRLIPSNLANANLMPDVLPLSTVLASATLATPTAIEGFTYNRGTNVPNVADFGVVGGMPADATYVVAWGPHAPAVPKPTMLRILIGTVPASPAGDDRIAEYVFSLK